MVQHHPKTLRQETEYAEATTTSIEVLVPNLLTNEQVVEIVNATIESDERLHKPNGPQGKASISFPAAEDGGYGEATPTLFIWRMEEGRQAVQGFRRMHVDEFAGLSKANIRAMVTSWITNVIVDVDKLWERENA